MVRQHFDRFQHTCVDGASNTSAAVSLAGDWKGKYFNTVAYLSVWRRLSKSCLSVGYHIWWESCRKQNIKPYRLLLICGSWEIGHTGICFCSRIYTVSQKTAQLWNCIARNYMDQFWWYLAEIFGRLQNRVCMFRFSCRFACYHVIVF